MDCGIPLGADRNSGSVFRFIHKLQTVRSVCPGFVSGWRGGDHPGVGATRRYDWKWCFHHYHEPHYPGTVLVSLSRTAARDTMNDSLVSLEPDRLLHEPARLRALVQLAVVKNADFTWLLSQTGLTRGNLSVQMSTMAEAGVVKIHKRFNNNRPQTLYELTEVGRQALRQYKQCMQSILDALPD